MDDRTDGRMDDGTDGWNDASRRPLLYVPLHTKMLYVPSRCIKYGMFFPFSFAKWWEVHNSIELMFCLPLKRCNFFLIEEGKLVDLYVCKESIVVEDNIAMTRTVRMNRLMNNFHPLVVTLTSWEVLFELCKLLFLRHRCKHQQIKFLHPSERPKYTKEKMQWYFMLEEWFF